MPAGNDAHHFSAAAQLLPYIEQQSVWSLIDFKKSVDDKVNATAWNQNLAAATRLHGGLLPARLVSVEGDPRAEDPGTFIGDVDYEHPALAAFAEPGFANLSGVTFKALWKVDAGQSSVLMRTNTGLPLLAERAYGKGRVALFTSSCDRDWTNFPVRPVAWIMRFIIQPLSPSSRGPSDRVTRACADLISNPGPARDRLTVDLYDYMKPGATDGIALRKALT